MKTVLLLPDARNDLRYTRLPFDKYSADCTAPPHLQCLFMGHKVVGKITAAYCS